MEFDETGAVAGGEGVVVRRAGGERVVVRDGDTRQELPRATELVFEHIDDVGAVMEARRPPQEHGELVDRDHPVTRRVEGQAQRSEDLWQGVVEGALQVVFELHQAHEELIPAQLEVVLELLSPEGAHPLVRDELPGRPARHLFHRRRGDVACLGVGDRQEVLEQARMAC